MKVTAAGTLRGLMGALFRSCNTSWCCQRRGTCNLLSYSHFLGVSIKCYGQKRSGNNIHKKRNPAAQPANHSRTLPLRLHINFPRRISFPESSSPIEFLLVLCRVLSGSDASHYWCLQSNKLSALPLSICSCLTFTSMLPDSEERRSRSKLLVCSRWRGGRFRSWRRCGKSVSLSTHPHNGRACDIR